MIKVYDDVPDEPQHVAHFRLLWPCIMNAGWRERYVLSLLLNHYHHPLQNTTPSIITQPVLSTPITCTLPPGCTYNAYTTHLSSRRCNTYITTPTPNTPDLTDIWIRHIYTLNSDCVYNSLLHTKTLWLSHLTVFFHSLQCRTPYAVVHSLVLLKMGVMMAETCWDRSLIINIRLVASCWFLSLHPM